VRGLIHPHALKVHLKHQTGEESRARRLSFLKARLMNGLERSYRKSDRWQHSTKVPQDDRVREGKTIHTTEVVFLKGFLGTAAVFVVRTRENFNPDR